MFVNKDPSITFRKAKEMDVNRLAASRVRKRYLYEVLNELLANGTPLALFYACEILEEIFYLNAHEGGEFVTVARANGTDRITDEMIAAARAVPVTAVVHFTRGVAYAWCHEDKKPSLTFMSKKQIAWCPACNRYFSALDVLIDRDQMSFVDAVRQLAD